MGLEMVFSLIFTHAPLKSPRPTCLVKASHFSQVCLRDNQQQPLVGQPEGADGNLGWDVTPAMGQESKISAHRAESERERCR